MLEFKLIGMVKSVFKILFCIFVTGCSCKPGVPPENSINGKNAGDMELGVNEERVIFVAAINPWNWEVNNGTKGLILKKEFSYQFEVRNIEKWVDDEVTSDPETGWTTWMRYPGALVPWLRRCPDEAWYTLIGALYDESGNWHCFKIGNGIKKIRPEATGRIYVFANDMNGYYSNNFGSLKLSIRRLE
ncbi:MAG: hypothetical protein GQ581_01040 [Methyloprofundus sp.]|nr:hypothetical protein [Methyloprofundus sp.]